ncbi:hypothetical protein [Amycolatopsis sp. NPDC004625]|uniref:membrane protein YczE n=1 Tax=Amycolatopsis sp. NPDC004625 TaxID=3154670 RepID=UPI0033B1643D
MRVRVADLLQSPLLPPGKPVRRTAQLLSGLTLYGISDALVVAAGLGVEPWDALAQGLTRTVGLSIGVWTNIIGAAVLLLWIPLRQKPGVGTLCNVLLVGTSMDLTLAVLPPLQVLWLRWVVLVGGIVLNGFATGCYLGAQAGPGPRDGLMTGLAARGYPVWAVRWGIELAVLLIGFLLGATVGIGTVLYACAIGPLAQLFMPLLDMDRKPA